MELGSKSFRVFNSYICVYVFTDLNIIIIKMVKNLFISQSLLLSARITTHVTKTIYVYIYILDK